MTDHLKFYIDGQWVEPHGKGTLDVVNPATEEPIGKIALGDATDVDRAVAAARKAFETFSRTSREDRLALLERVLAVYKERAAELAAAVTQEMGAPVKLANAAQVPSGIGHFMATIRALKEYQFEHDIGTTRVVREPIGVVGMITPWNWPLNQITCKVAPALAAGCTMVLKPSEIAPINAVIFAQILHDAGVPAGVFNLVNGDGPTVGAAMSAHPGIDMMSFTGSTRAGVEVARAAAPTVKRVAQELGGKSANIVLDDADFEKVIGREMFNMCRNSGQSCNAGSRLLVPIERMDEAAAIAAAAADKVKVGDPTAEDTAMGPVASKAQFDKIQALIQKGIDEGAKLVAGGLGRPAGFERGWFVRPTVFSHATNDMTIAREEIFGPVITIIGYKDEEDAIRIANDTVYGLSGYVSSGDLARAQAVAMRLRTGMVHLNGAPGDPNAPFGGYKQSGNGREWGVFGLEDYLEVKAIMGFTPRPPKA
jgi:aldehyde dehydrogenase (NAD+)